MSAPAAAYRRIAVLGNPNTGKTTIFNALTGHRARVGNYAGVTVEKREGTLTSGGVTLIDLPGTYSLAAHSPDEMVSVNLLLGALEGEQRPDAILVVADASNLERNLFLATQAMETGLPVIIALNMMDIAESEGFTIDIAKLEAALGVPVVPTVARDRRGFDILESFLRRTDLPPPTAPPMHHEEFLRWRDRTALALAAKGLPPRLANPFLVGRALVEAEGIAQKEIAAAGGAAEIDAARAALTAAGLKLRSYEATARYRWLRETLAPIVSHRKPEGTAAPGAFSDRMDRVLTHRVWGTVIFAALMMLVFQSIYSWSGPLMDAIEGLFGALGEWVGARMGEGDLKSLVVDGVIAGIGGVLVFLPQICILFLFIALLEDIGYMARAAFLMDRLLSRVGLSGRSFIPMLSSFACAIPGIMAARTIEDRRDRLTTIFVSPFMSCSARLPVYALMIGAFVPDEAVAGPITLPALTLFAMYLVGILFAIPTALLLKKTVLKSKTPAFLIELPPYRRPLLSNVLHRVYERAKSFVLRAGTVILAVSIVIWAMLYYPKPTAQMEADRNAEIAAVRTNAETLLAPIVGGAEPAGALLDAEELPEDTAREIAAAVDEYRGAVAMIENQFAGEQARRSILGRMGHAVEPIVEPLGWDWRIGMAAIASFPAREVIIATMGVIFDFGVDAADDEDSLKERIKAVKRPDGTPLLTLPVALGIMVFFALCMQCGATLAVMRRETNSWRWPLFAFGYMTALAYVGALVTYQVSKALLG